jgi:hypothetical protein
LEEVISISAYDNDRHDGDKLYMVCFSFISGPTPIKEFKEIISQIPDGLELVNIKLDPHEYFSPTHDSKFGKDIRLYFAKIKNANQKAG